MDVTTEYLRPIRNDGGALSHTNSNVNCNRISKNSVVKSLLKSPDVVDEKPFLAFSEDQRDQHFTYSLRSRCDSTVTRAPTCILYYL